MIYQGSIRSQRISVYVLNRTGRIHICSCAAVTSGPADVTASTTAVHQQLDEGLPWKPSLQHRDTILFKLSGSAFKHKLHKQQN